MCDLCDHPDLTMDEHLDHVRDRLTRERFVLQSVTGSRTSPELTYSIGLTASGLPELIVVGVRAAEAGPLLRLWGDYLLDESLVLPGEALTCGPWVMEAVEVRHPSEHLPVAAAVHGGSVRALQLAWCDSAGRWPWQPGHRARRAGQPLLGDRAPVFCDEHRPDRLDVPPIHDAPQSASRCYLGRMRTTITLASDVAAAVSRLQRERGRGVSDAVNELIRRGLTSTSDRRRFTQTSSAMGEPTVPLDDVAGLLEVLDGPGAS